MLEKESKSLLEQLAKEASILIEDGTSLFRAEALLEKLKVTAKTTEELKQCFEMLASLEKYSKDFLAKSNIVTDSVKKMKWLDLLDCADTLYRIAARLPKIHINRPMDINYCEFLMQNGRYDLPGEQEVVDIEDPEWETVLEKSPLLGKRYILQKSLKLENYARIIQRKYQRNVRISHGHIEAMEEKLRRFQQPKFFRPGDIIYIDREDVHIQTKALLSYIKKSKAENGGEEPITIPMPAYAHVGVYIGMGQVIHFAGFKDLIGDKTIHASTLKEFVHGHNTTKTEKDIYVMHFPGNGKIPYKLYPDTSKLEFHPAHLEFFNESCLKDLNCFSPQETIARAKAIAKKGDYGAYDMLGHNCEHFAFYCKTGQKISLQISNVNETLDLLLTAVQFINLFF